MLQANVAIASKRPLIRNLNAHKKKKESLSARYL